MTAFIIRVCALSVFCSVLAATVSQAESELTELLLRATQQASEGRLTEAVGTADQYIARAEKLVGPASPDYAMALHTKAVVLTMQGRLPEAEQLLMVAIAIAERAMPAPHGNLVTHYLGLAVVLKAQGREREATAFICAGGKHSTDVFGADHVATRVVRSQCTNEAAPTPAEIEAFFEDAARNNSRVDRSNEGMGAGFFQWGIRIQNYGGCDAAIPIFEKAISYFAEAKTGHRYLIEEATAESNLASCYVRTRQAARAIPLLQRFIARNSITLETNYTLQAAARSTLGSAYMQLGMTGAAFSEHLVAVRVYAKEFELTRAFVPQPLDEKGFTYIPASLLEAAWRFSREFPDRAAEASEAALEALQWHERTVASTALVQMAARTSIEDSKLAAQIRRGQDLAAKRQKIRENISVALALGAQDVARAAIEQLNAVDGELQALNQEVPEKYVQLVNPRALGAREIACQLRNDEALLSFASLEEQVYAVLVLAGCSDVPNVRWARFELGSAALAQQVTALRCGLDVALWEDADTYARCVESLGKHLTHENIDGQFVEVPPFDLQRAHQVYTALFGPFDHLIKDKHLIIVPSGPLTSIPFHVLVTNPPQTGIPRAVGEYREAAWLGTRQPITVLPSVASLNALREHAKESRAPKSYLGIGNPLLKGEAKDTEAAEVARAWQQCSSLPAGRMSVALTRGLRALGSFRTLFRGTRADIELVRTLAPLPDSAKELCEIGRRLGVPDSEILLGARATETTIKNLSEPTTPLPVGGARLTDYRIVHFATHGALAGQVGDFAEPGLILTPPAKGSSDARALERDDGYMSASEIAALKLDADWVILSACSTAGGGHAGEDTEALSGLARAFFYAGARALLVSHWAVGSEASVKLTTRAFAALEADRGVGRAEALRIAMRELIDNGGVIDAHPMVWAPFVVVGEGAR